MGLFKRHKPPVEDQTPDEHLPMTVPQAMRLRALVRRVLAEQGIEVVVHADHMRDDSGRKLGLWNLAALCADASEREWPVLVRGHVTALLQPEDLDGLGDEELVARVHLRLVDRLGFPDPSRHPRALALGDSLLAVLSVDMPTTVSTPLQEFWDARGGLERWRATGHANLLAVALSDELQHQQVAPEDGAGGFEVVLGDSFFTGSTAIVVAHLSRRFTPEQDRAHDLGVLVAAPFRHQVAWRVLDGTTDSALALNNLFGFAMLGYADAPGPISPHVYWVKDGEWRQVTRIEGDEAHVEVDDDLALALGMTPG